MALYRNTNTGDVYNTDDHDTETNADVTGRDNFVQVGNDEAGIPFYKWQPVTDQPDAPKVASAMDDDLIPADKHAGPVDVPQSGATGSKSTAKTTNEKPAPKASK